MGPDHQRHYESGHDDPRRLADLWPVKGSFGSLFGDHGQGPCRYRRHSQRAGAGRVTNTGMVPLEAGYDRAEMIQPAVMTPPLNWLVSDAAGGVTGRRFLAVHWDPSLPPEEAAAKAGAPVAWTGIATMPIEPPRRG